MCPKAATKAQSEAASSSQFAAAHRHGLPEQLPIRAEGPQALGEALHQLFHLVLGHPGHPPGDCLEHPGGVRLAPREHQHERAEGGEQDGADHGDGDVGAVETVERESR